MGEESFDMPGEAEATDGKFTAEGNELAPNEEMQRIMKLEEDRARLRAELAAADAQAEEYYKKYPNMRPESRQAA